MDSLWSEADAAQALACYAAQGVPADLALRTYSARLLGRVPRLVMHGGGNTSVKLDLPDLFGEATRVLCVKGSGRDLATITPDGHPAVRLTPLQRLRTLERLSDEDMVNALRQNLLDTAAPNPSVETLLHAWLPHRFVDHTHSVTSTAIAALPDADVVCRSLFGGRIAWVPYIMPGFALAQRAARSFEADPSVEGLLLAKHGIFTFGDTARGSYESMIEMVSLAERHIARHGRPNPAFHPVRLPDRVLPPGTMLPLLRGALAEAAGTDAPQHWLLSARSSARIRRFVDGQGLDDYARRGVATPEQVIRIKAQPCLLPPPDAANPDGWGAASRRATRDFASAYRDYFLRHDARVGGRRPLDGLPRVFAVPGAGIVGVGRSAVAAAAAAEIAEAWIDAVLDAEAIGRFCSISEAEHFDMEYWSLEQAKLAARAAPACAGRVVAITGAAGAIGSATARAFARQGAELALLDCDRPALERLRAAIGGAILALDCDVTDANAVDAAFDAVAARFGGVDIVVSNAGAAHAGAMAELPQSTLRSAFEINFFAHQAVAQAGLRILRRQEMGGVLLFNVSKQAVDPGPGLGAYGTAKAALLALVRQYALEHGQEGIRVNAVNADRIRSGLLSPAMIAERAAARGVSEAAYLSGNLLGAEVRAEDVADAFVASALLERTTGNVVTVDGGNVAAMLR